MAVASRIVFHHLVTSTDAEVSRLWPVSCVFSSQYPRLDIFVNCVFLGAYPTPPFMTFDSLNRPGAVCKLCSMCHASCLTCEPRVGVLDLERLKAVDFPVEQTAICYGVLRCHLSTVAVLDNGGQELALERATEL